MHARSHEISVIIEPGIEIAGTLCVPDASVGLVIMAHPNASARRAIRERQVATVLERAGLATLSLDLLTPTEERAERFTHEFRFDIPLLAGRMILATSWLRRQPETHSLPVGYFGNNTAAAAALVAAAHESDRVRAVVARGGRVDLAGDDLSDVRAPTLLVVGSADVPVMAATRAVQPKLTCETRLEVIPGAAHLFEQSGALELVAFRARDWFLRHVPFAPVISRDFTPASRQGQAPISAARH
jgi:putative phosphoribosyl transferase